MIARPGGPQRLLDLDPRHFLAFIEGVLRESEHHNKALDGLYADAVKPPPVPAAGRDRSDRNREIQKLSRIFG